MSEDRAYRVFKIENGTVIDHIKSPLALKIIDILKLQGDGIISISMNFDSDKTEKKILSKLKIFIYQKQKQILLPWCHLLQQLI